MSAPIDDLPAGPERPVRRLSTGLLSRESILVAAMAVFAEKGYFGSPTSEIAGRAGLSQAYLFRFFPTKRDLFVAVIDRCHQQVAATLRHAGSAAGSGDPRAALAAMRTAYGALRADRQLLLLQIQAQAACADPVVRAAVQRGTAAVIAAVADTSRADEADLLRFIAFEALANVAVAIAVDEITEPWAECLTEHLGRPRS